MTPPGLNLATNARASERLLEQSRARGPQRLGNGDWWSIPQRRRFPAIDRNRRQPIASGAVEVCEIEILTGLRIELEHGGVAGKVYVARRIGCDRGRGESFFQIGRNCQVRRPGCLRDYRRQENKAEYFHGNPLELKNAASLLY